MKWGLRALGCGIVLTLMLLVGISLWVGVRVGMASLIAQTNITQASPSLLGERGLGKIRGRLRHGVVGEVDSVDTQSIIVLNRDGERRTVFVTPDTLISRGGLRSGPDAFTRIDEQGLTRFQDLQPGVRIIIIGRPRDNGQIEARIIRLVPADTPAERSRPGPPNKGKGPP